MDECSHISDEITSNPLKQTLKQRKFQKIHDQSEMKGGLDAFS